jgi:hypothetical protein
MIYRDLWFLVGSSFLLPYYRLSLQMATSILHTDLPKDLNYNTGRHR